MSPAGRRRLAALSLLLPVCFGCGGEAPPERIVLVVIDTLRKDHVSHYGGTVPTPHLDALAERGQALTRAVSSSHQTTMSMAALFTGRAPSLERVGDGDPVWNGRVWCGLARFAEPSAEDPCIPRALPTLAEAMREAGYWTMGIASNDFLFAPAGFERGFDDWLEVQAEARLFTPPRARARAGGHVNAAVERALGRRRGDRFFLYVHYMDVHDYGILGKSYAKGVARADAALGALLRRLEARGLADGATIVVTSDHGERLGEQRVLEGRPHHLGNPSFEPVLRVPLIVAPPLFDDASRLVRSEDLFRALLGLAGAPVAGLPRDLRPDELFVSELRWRTYRRGPWKSFEDRITGETTLVNLARDPEETTDVAEAHPEIVEAHRRRIDELSRQLAIQAAVDETLSDDDEARLRSLGYLE